MDLFLKLNEKLKETEQELEKLLKSTQSELTSQPQNVVLVFSTAVPSTLATTFAPNIPLVIAETIEVIGRDIGTTQVGTLGQSTEELIKSMEEMKLQVFELRKVKEKFVTLEQKYDVSKINFVE